MDLVLFIPRVMRRGRRHVDACGRMKEATRHKAIVLPQRPHGAWTMPVGILALDSVPSPSRGIRPCFFFFCSRNTGGSTDWGSDQKNPPNERPRERAIRATGAGMILRQRGLAGGIRHFAAATRSPSSAFFFFFYLGGGGGGLLRHGSNGAGPKTARFQCCNRKVAGYCRIRQDSRSALTAAGLRRAAFASALSGQGMSSRRILKPAFR